MFSALFSASYVLSTVVLPSEVQPEDDKRSGVGRVGVVDVERKKRLVEIEVLWQDCEDGRRQTCEASVCRESKETRGRKAEQVVR